MVVMEADVMITTPQSGTIQRELEMVQSAVDMVAGRHAASVTLGGLTFGDELLLAANRMAIGRHVRIVPLWTADDRGVDIRVERVDDA
jgi:hypothetical protein